MHRALRVSLVIVSTLVAACDSPSGGKGRVDCAQVPQAPACQPTTTSDSDTTSGGADVVDDTRPNDEDTATTTDTTTTTASDTSGGQDVRVCDEGHYQCADGRSEVCLGNAWTLDDLCNDNERCATNGRCECVPSCPANACDDGCGGDCGGCEPDEECNAQGMCAESEVLCADIQSCFVGQCVTPCANATSTACSNCKTICKAGATSQAKQSWDAMQTCFACTTYTCLHDCSRDIGICMFEKDGLDSCIEIMQCAPACGGDAACARDCYEEGTITAQGKALLLNACVNQVCGSDTACGQASVGTGGQCEGYYQLCIDD